MIGLFTSRGVVDVACEQNATGYCEHGERGSETCETSEGDTLKDSDWYFRVYFSTRDFGLTFQNGRGIELVAFADAEDASKATDRRSVFGGP